MVISVQGILVLLKKSQQILVSISEILHDELKIKETTSWNQWQCITETCHKD